MHWYVRAIDTRKCKTHVNCGSVGGYQEVLRLGNDESVREAWTAELRKEQEVAEVARQQEAAWRQEAAQQKEVAQQLAKQQQLQKEERKRELREACSESSLQRDRMQCMPGNLMVFNTLAKHSIMCIVAYSGYCACTRIREYTNGLRAIHVLTLAKAPANGACSFHMRVYNGED